MTEVFTNHPEYDALPEAIKATISQKDFACMGDAQRRSLMEDMTMPEPETE